MALFHALIRTHHITSRKKVAHLRKAAGKFECYALLRSGGCPGIMYCKGSEEAVRGWVGTVQVSWRIEGVVAFHQLLIVSLYRGCDIKIFS